MFYCKSQLSEHIIPTLLCFFFFVFLCSPSAGFFVVLPWKPGKVTMTVFIGHVKFASQFPLDSWTFCFYMSNVLFASIKIVYGLGIRRAVHGGFAAWKQVSLSSVDNCCEFVGVESEKYSCGEATDSDRIEAVIGGLMQSLLGNKSSCFWRNLENYYLCWDFCFTES